MPINHQWVLKRRPVGEIRPGDLEYVSKPTPDLQPGEALVRTFICPWTPPTGSG